MIVGYEPGQTIWKKRLRCKWVTWSQYQSSQCLSDYYSKMCRFDPDPEPIDFEKKSIAQSTSKDFSINDRSIKPVDEIDFDYIIDPNSCFYRCCEWEWYATQTAGVWLIQNSWGTGWGDAGFIRLKDENGVGVSGMNTHIRWVTVV